jgi:hypothetical protein
LTLQQPRLTEPNPPVSCADLLYSRIQPPRIRTRTETRPHPAPLPPYRLNKIVSEVRSHQGAGDREEKYRRPDPEAMIVNGMKADSHEWHSGLGRPGHDNRVRGAFPRRTPPSLPYILPFPSFLATHTQKYGAKNGLRRYKNVAGPGPGPGHRCLKGSGYRTQRPRPAPPLFAPALCSFDPMLPKHGPRSPVACKSVAVLQQ